MLKKQKKKEREARYVQAAAEFYYNIELMGFVATFVLPQYSEVWSKAIDDRRDFNVAIHAKRKSLNSMVAQSSVIYSDMEDQLKQCLKLRKKIQISTKNFMMNTKRCTALLHL